MENIGNPILYRRLDMAWTIAENKEKGRIQNDPMDLTPEDGKYYYIFRD
jgi:hypothetical protein